MTDVKHFAKVNCGGVPREIDAEVRSNLQPHREHGIMLTGPLANGHANGHGSGKANGNANGTTATANGAGAASPGLNSSADHKYRNGNSNGNGNGAGAAAAEVVLTKEELFVPLGVAKEKMAVLLRELQGGRDAPITEMQRLAEHYERLNRQTVQQWQQHMGRVQKEVRTRMARNSDRIEQLETELRMREEQAIEWEKSIEKERNHHAKQTADLVRCRCRCRPLRSVRPPLRCLNKC
jgi:hypothetical protein